MDTRTSTRPTVLPAETVAAVPEVPLGPMEGVTHRVLWHDTTSMAGVLRVAGGHRMGAHAHRTNHHHMWVVEGRAAVLGADLGPGSYVHIPSGVEHEIDARATEGCTVFYLYLAPPV
jgi:mannose-6-phosphate isomerase-like protein (cupin superfamily)